MRDKKQNKKDSGGRNKNKGKKIVDKKQKRVKNEFPKLFLS